MSNFAFVSLVLSASLVGIVVLVTGLLVQLGLIAREPWDGFKLRLSPVVLGAVLAVAAASFVVSAHIPTPALAQDEVITVGSDDAVNSVISDPGGLANAAPNAPTPTATVRPGGAAPVGGGAPATATPKPATATSTPKTSGTAAPAATSTPRPAGPATATPTTAAATATPTTAAATSTPKPAGPATATPTTAAATATPTTAAAAAALTTDDSKYHLGDTITITGTGFKANADVTITVSLPDKTTKVLPVVKASATGGLTTKYAPPTVSGRYDFAATDGTNKATTSATVADANPSANLDQCANDPIPSPRTDGCDTNANQWVNGNLGASKSVYLEGDSIPYRLTFGNLATGIGNPHTVTIEWDTTKSSKHAIDYLTTVNQSVSDANPCLGVSGCSTFTTFAIPTDPQVTGGGVTPIAGNFRLYGGSITSVSPYIGGGVTFPLGDNSRRITITFTTSVANPVLAWGGHIATRTDWGLNNSAVAIPGSPYHTRLIDLDGSGGNQDRSLSADAVIFPGSITIVKDASPDGAQVFNYTTTGGLSPSSFSLHDDGSAPVNCITTPAGSVNTQCYTSITTFTTYTVTETAVSGWELSFNSANCLVAGANGGSTSHTASAWTINLAEGENVICKFVNTRQHLSITKVATESGYNAVGQVIHYTITATNDGAGTLTSVTVTDPNATGLVCTPANGSTLAPGASMTCTASHTITQADIDAGSFFNQACVDDGAGGAAQACADVTTPGTKSPALSITKVATESGYNAVGQVIHYTIVATNTGNVTLTNVTVTDAQVSDLSCTPAVPVASLTPGSTINCTASHTVTQADLNAGSFFNQACVDDGPQGAASKCADVTTPGTQSPALSITKVATESGYNAVGQVIHYTVVATNTGNVTLTSVTVTDPNAAGLVCTPANGSTLAPGASMNCTASHTVTQADIDSGSFFNQACVDDGPQGAASKCADVTTPGTQSPALSITKVATESGYNAVGQVIHYTIVATNTGNVTLTSVTVTDPNAAGLVCTPANGSTLAPGASMNCTASHTVTQADIDSGSFFNQACVDDGPQGAASKCADVTTPGTQSPALSITKVATESGYNAVGQVIHYTIVATNTGNVTLTSVTVTDPNAAGLVCTPANGSTLAPGASMNCTASHTVTQADIDSGSFFNQACVDDGPQGAASKCADVTTPGTQSPALSITKVATESGYNAVGQVIHYTVVATNTGNVTLTNVTVTDAQVSDLSCTPAVPVASLAPTASITCTATHTVTQADLDSGSFFNQACVDDGAGGADPKCADVTTPGTQSPALSITKVATETGYNAVGQVIHYTVVATNTGNVTLTNVTVTDAQVSDLSCTPAVPVASLAPTASITCTATHTVTQADLDSGSFFNQACVDDGAGGADPKCADVTTPGTQSPALSITKVATESGYNAVGQVIHYTVVATNTGNVTLTNVTVTDAQVSDLSCTPAVPVASLAPTASITCTATHTVTQADIDSGSFFNQACVDDGAGGADPKCADVTTPGTQSPALSITKVATESGYNAVGQVIHYTVVATNTGNVTLTNVTVTDAQVSDLSCTPAVPVASLAPTASITCTATHTVTQADLDSGSFFNQACVDDGAGGADPKCADVTTPGTQSPALSITKVATESGYNAVGQVIHYTVVATNTGNVTLTNVTVTDAQVSDLSCTPAVPVASLAPGSTINCTASHTVTQADLDSGSFFNQACVDDGAGGADPKCADVTTPGTKSPALSITKVATETGYNAVGQVIHYTVVATNTGNVTLTNVTVTDAQVSDLSCTPAVPVASLAPTASITCTASHTVTQADLDSGSFFNQACVDDGAGGADPKCADVTTPGTKSPALSITKVATESGYNAVGQVIHYTVVATNTGNVTLTNVTVTDAQVSDLSCTPAVPVASLAPTASITCTASHTVTQADLDSGSFFNQACVDDGAGGADPKCADVTTPGTKSPALSITKVATETGYNAVGQVIHYTIVATNTGNVTLTNVTVTDAQVSDLSCTPAVPVASLTPTASITCTASHTVTQADLDSGSFFNQACVDDGAGGADPKCADVTTPGTQNPHLLITKTDNLNPVKYDHVGQVVTYTITATNDGNVTLHSVTVSDTPTLDGFTCTPANGSTLAPGASMTCTGTHTITQADMSALFFTDTGCVSSTEVTTPTCAPDTVTGRVPTVVAQITPTATTCTQFASGTSADLSVLTYSLQNGKINQVAPGVFFYWVTVSGGGTYTITETSTPSFKPFAIADGSFVFDSNCIKVGAATVSQNATSGAVTVTFSGTGTFYIGIKYSSGSVKDENAPNPSTVHYTFTTSGVANSTDSLDLVKQ